jgi:hypothetical protein
LTVVAAGKKSTAKNKLHECYYIRAQGPQAMAPFLQKRKVFFVNRTDLAKCT